MCVLVTVLELRGDPKITSCRELDSIANLPKWCPKTRTYHSPYFLRAYGDQPPTPPKPWFSLYKLALQTRAKAKDVMQKKRGYAAPCLLWLVISDSGKIPTRRSAHRRGSSANMLCLLLVNWPSMECETQEIVTDQHSNKTPFVRKRWSSIGDVPDWKS